MANFKKAFKYKRIQWAYSDEKMNFETKQLTRVALPNINEIPKVDWENNAENYKTKIGWWEAGGHKRDLRKILWEHGSLLTGRLNQITINDIKNNKDNTDLETWEIDQPYANEFLGIPDNNYYGNENIPILSLPTYNYIPFSPLSKHVTTIDEIEQIRKKITKYSN